MWKSIERKFLPKQKKIRSKTQPSRFKAPYRLNRKCVWSRILSCCVPFVNVCLLCSQALSQAPLLCRLLLLYCFFYSQCSMPAQSNDDYNDDDDDDRLCSGSNNNALLSTKRVRKENADRSGHTMQAVLLPVCLVFFMHVSYCLKNFFTCEVLFAFACCRNVYLFSWCFCSCRLSMCVLFFVFRFAFRWIFFPYFFLLCLFSHFLFVCTHANRNRQRERIKKQKQE